jgi:hypothetical protein
MALVLSLAEGDEFNIASRRYRLLTLRKPNGCTVVELGGCMHEVSLDAPATLPDGVTLQEGLRKQQDVVRLMIVAPKTTKIWRGEYKYDAPVALLAPVPEEHLIFWVRAEAARLVRKIVTPRGIDETVAACIARAARKLGWTYSRTEDVWRQDARRQPLTGASARLSSGLPWLWHVGGGNAESTRLRIDGARIRRRRVG